MKNAEIRDLTDAELQEKIAEEKQVLVKMKMNHAISPIENPNKIKFQRRLIARLKTELTARSKNVAQ